MNINRIDKSGSCWPWYYSRSNIFTKVNYFWTFLQCTEHILFFLTLEWAELLVSVPCWMGTIYSHCSQGHPNSCPLAGIHIFPPNAFTNRSCFSLLKQVAPTAQSSASKARLLKGVVLPAEPWVSDRTPLSLPYSAVFSKEHSFGVTIYQYSWPT